MANEYKVPEEYASFCKEVVETINELYGENGVSASVSVHTDDVMIKVKDKSGFYESITGLSEINIERSIEENAKHVVKCAVENFLHENFD